MRRTDFMAVLYSKLQQFETYWNRHQRELGEDEFPNDLPEAEWWEQFEAWLSVDQEGEA